MLRGLNEYKNDIFDAICKIEKCILNIMYEEFLEDSKTQDAIIRNLEIIGEAVKRLDDDFKNNTNISKNEWRNIAGMRDILTHDYFGVDIEVVWDVINNKLLKLKNAVEV